MSENMKHLLQIIKDLDTDGNGAQFNDILEKGGFELFELKELIQKAKFNADIYEPRPEYFKAFSYDIFEELEAKEEENDKEKEKKNFKYENGDIHFEIERFFMILFDIEGNSEIHSDGNDRTFKDYIEIKSVKLHTTNVVGKKDYRSAGEVIFYRSNHKELLKNNGSYIIVIYGHKNKKIDIHAVKKIKAESINHLIKKSTSKEKIGVRWTRFFENVCPIPLFSISESSELINFRNAQRIWLSMLNDLSILHLRVSNNLNKRDYFSEARYLVQHRAILFNEVIFDIDFDEWEDTEYYGRKIIETLKELEIPYILAYSGGKGIHIHVFFILTKEQKSELYWESIDIESSFIRMEIFKYILKKTDVDEGLIGKSKPFDTSCVNFSDTSKGHLIRAFGGKKNSFKTLIEVIPDKRPIISYEKVIFPEYIEEWAIPDEIFKIILQNYQTEKEVNNAN